MMGKVISPLNIGSTINLVLHGFSTLHRVPLVSLRCYSVASFQRSYHFGSQPVCLVKRQNEPVCNKTIEKGTVQCYCTKVIEKKPPIKAKVSETEMTSSANPYEKELSAESNYVTRDRDEKSKIPSESIVDLYWNEVSNDDDDPIYRRALVESEVEVLRQEGGPVPDILTSAHWEELLTKNSLNGRKKYLRFLFLNQMRKENDKKKKEIKRLEREELRKSFDMSDNRFIGEDGHIKYGLWHNTIFIKILDTTMNKFYNGRVLSELMFGQQMVLDLGFDEHMTSKETQRLATQIMHSFASNRLQTKPFYIHLCNAERDAATVRKLHTHIPPLFDKSFPMDIHSGSYLDHFPKEQLVYLTPHAKEELTRFDHNAVYIVGGLVDLGNSEPYTLAKAKREGIQMKKFPLERYLDWGQGNKCLTIDHTVSILLDLKHTGDWQYSLRHVPKRKLRKFEDIQSQREDYLKKTLRASKRYGNQSRAAKHSGNQWSNNRLKLLYEE